MIADERETTVNCSDGDDVVHIWSAQAKFIRRLREHPRVTEIAHGLHDGTEWAKFTLPKDQWSPLSGVKRSSKDDETQRERASQRMTAMNAAKKAATNVQVEQAA